MKIFSKNYANSTKLVFDIVPIHFLKTVKKNKRQISSVILSLIIVLTLFGESIFPNQVQAVTYKFFQTDWSGGATQVAPFPAEPTNRNGWSKYWSKTSKISAGADAKIITGQEPSSDLRSFIQANDPASGPNGFSSVLGNDMSFRDDRISPSGPKGQAVVSQPKTATGSGGAVGAATIAVQTTTKNGTGGTVGAATTVISQQKTAYGTGGTVSAATGWTGSWANFINTGTLSISTTLPDSGPFFNSSIIPYSVVTTSTLCSDIGKYYKQDGSSCTQGQYYCTLVKACNITAYSPTSGSINLTADPASKVLLNISYNRCSALTCYSQGLLGSGSFQWTSQSFYKVPKPTTVAVSGSVTVPSGSTYASYTIPTLPSGVTASITNLLTTGTTWTYTLNITNNNLTSYTIPSVTFTYTTSMVVPTTVAVSGSVTVPSGSTYISNSLPTLPSGVTASVTISNTTGTTWTYTLNITNNNLTSYTIPSVTFNYSSPTTVNTPNYTVTIPTNYTLKQAPIPNCSGGIGTCTYNQVSITSSAIVYNLTLTNSSVSPLTVNYVDFVFKPSNSVQDIQDSDFSVLLDPVKFPQGSSVAGCNLTYKLGEGITASATGQISNCSITQTTLNYHIHLENASSVKITVATAEFMIITPIIGETLISSPFNMSDPFAVLSKIEWNQKTPTNSSVQFQVRVAPDAGGAPGSWSVWMGPTGSESDYFSSSDPSCTPILNTQTGLTSVLCGIQLSVAQAVTNARWIQYKMILNSTDGLANPEVHDAMLHYTINSAPVVSSVSATQVATAGSSNLGKVSVSYSVSDADNSNLYGELFYDVGIKLDNDISSVADQLNFTLPAGADLANLGLPDAGVLLVDNEEIYYTKRGGTYVGGYPSINLPLKRGYGPLSGGTNLTTSQASHLKGAVVWVKASDLGVSGSGAGDIICESTCTKSILWNAGLDFQGKYSNTQKIRVQVNDKEGNKQSGGQDSNAFSLDTKTPNLGANPFSLTQSSTLINFSGYGWKSNSPSIAFNIGTPITSDASGEIDNLSGSDRLSFCSTASCGTPTGADLLAGTASGWSPPPLPVWSSSYDYTLASQEISSQTINLAVVDNVGNKLSAGAQTIAYDKTPPPLPTQASFIAQDISGSVAQPIIFLQWYPIAWTTQKDAYERTDFKNFIVYRHDPDTTNCSNGGATVGGLLFCYVTTLSDSTGTNVTSYVDQGVQDTKTYTYRVITEDDIGNKWDITSGSVPQSTPIKVSVSGAPKITPQLTFLSKTTQTKYDDPVTIYWDTKDGSGVGLSSDSQVAYIESQTLPSDFSSAATQGNSEQKSVGIVQADGSCACHKVTLIGLKSGTKYYFEMRSLYGSEIGKLNGSSYYIDTMPAPPKLKATITNVLPADAAVLSTPTSATITWDTNDAITGIPMDTNGYVDYFGPGESTAKSVGGEMGAKSHSVVLSGLTSDTTYTYNIRSKPTNGDADVTTFPSSGNRSFKTKAVTEDTDPPQVTNVRVVSNTGTGAQICWDTPNEPTGASSIVEIWTGSNDHMVAQTQGEYVQNNHCVTLNTLTPLTDYTYKAISYDNGSPANRGESGDINFTTVAAQEIAVPAISNLRNDFPSPNSVVIYWDTVSSSDATKSVDADSFVQIGSASPTSFELTPVSSPALLSNHVITVTGLSPGKTYYYKVQSTNANKVSTPDDSVARTCKDISGTNIICSFTTPLSPELPPKIVTTGTDKIQVIVSANDADVTNTATIIWHTDKPGNSLVEFGSKFVDKPDGSRVPEYERGFVGNVNAYDTTHVVEFPQDLVENADYHFRVRTVDKFKQVVQHPPGDPTSLDDPDDSYPPCDLDPIDNPNRYNCLDPSFKTAVSAFTRAQEVKEELDITGVGAVLVTDTTATINWSTNRAADSEVDFGQSTNYGCLGGACPLGEKYKVTSMGGITTTNLLALTRTHSVTIAGLTPKTKYFYKVTSTDVADIQKTKTTNAAGDDLSFTTSEGVGKFTEAQYKSIQEQLDALALKLQGVNSQLVSNLNQQAIIEQQLQQANLTQTQIDDLQRQLAELKSQAAQLQQVQANIIAEKTQLEKDLEEQKAQSMDQTPPVITDITVSNITPESAIVSWTTDEKASSIVKYGETKDYVSLAGDYATLITEHSVKLENLDGGTEYHFIVISYDLAVNRAESEDTVFKTTGFKKTPDDKEKLQQARQKLEKALGINSKLNTQNIINLLAEFSEDQVAKLLNDLGIELVSPPQFTGGDPIVKTTQTSATITWTTNKESDSRIGYIQDKDFKKNASNPYPTETGDAESFVTKHEVVISDLQPGTLYHFQLRSREAAGRTGKSQDYIFKTKSVKPEFSKIKIINATERAVTLEWATNIPTKSVVTYVDNPKTKDERSQGDSQLVRQHTLTLIDLFADTKYKATLRAEDEEGITTFSKPFDFATTRDTLPPEIVQMKAELSLVPGRQDDVQAIVSWRTDEPATSKIMYDDGFSKNTEYSASSQEQKDLTLFHVVVLAKLRPATIYRFRAFSLDASGNLGQSKEFKILTPRKEESVLELIIKNFEETFGFLRGKQ